MNLPVSGLPKCENHANPHQHLYMADMWRGPRQMCNSSWFVAPCALYLSQESYYLPGWAEKHLKHDSNNNKVITSQLVCLLQNTLYFSFAKRVLLHLISLMNTIKTTTKVRHSLVSNVRIYNIVDLKTLRRTPDINSFLSFYWHISCSTDGQTGHDSGTSNIDFREVTHILGA